MEKVTTEPPAAAAAAQERGEAQEVVGSGRRKSRHEAKVEALSSRRASLPAVRRVISMCSSSLRPNTFLLVHKEFGWLLIVLRGSLTVCKNL